MSRSLRHIIIFGGIIGFAAVLSGGCPAAQQSGGTDDDRPPIIVSGGTLHLRAVAKDRGNNTNQARGAWKKADNGWYHDHGGPPAQHLLVNVLYGSGSTGCDNPEHDFDVREFNFTYTEVLDTTFRIFIDAPNPTAPGRLMTDANASVDPKVPFWLDVGGLVARPKSVTFPSLKATCTLDQLKGQVHIYQSTK